MTAGDNGTPGTGGDLSVESGLAAAAAEVRIGPVPVERILAGGRRIRRRRRTVVGVLALASVVALGGGTAAGLHAFAGGGTAGPALAGSSVGAGLSGGGAPALVAGDTPSASASASAVRDPFTPTRVVIGHGTLDGKEWKLWEALWPVAPKERAYEQAVAVWQERQAVDPSVEKPTEAFVQDYWHGNEDVINDYVTVDGVRQKYDTVGSAFAPGHTELWMSTKSAGFVLGPRAKDATPGPLPIRLVLLTLGWDIGKVVVTWSDGSVLEPELVTVGDAPELRAVVAERPGKKVVSWELFDRNGTKVPDGKIGFLTD